MGLLAAFCIITAPKPIQSVSFEISPSPQYPHRVSRHISSIPRSCFPSLKHLACIIAVCSYCTACSRVERTGSETYVAWKVPVLPAQIRTTTQWGKYQDIKGQWKIGFSASEGDADPYMIMKPLFFFWSDCTSSPGNCWVKTNWQTWRRSRFIQWPIFFRKTGCIIMHQAPSES